MNVTHVHNDICICGISSHHDLTHNSNANFFWTKQFKIKQAEKLKSREMKEGRWRMMKDDEGWMKDEWRMMKDEWWMMKDDDVKLLRGFADRQTDRRTNEQTFVIVESLSRLKTLFGIWQNRGGCEGGGLKVPFDKNGNLGL